MLQLILGYMCLFQLWFPQGIRPVVRLLGHMVLALFVILVVCQLCPFVPLIARDIFILSKLHQAHCKMNQFGKSMSCTVVLSVH